MLTADTAVAKVASATMQKKEKETVFRNVIMIGKHKSLFSASFFLISCLFSFAWAVLCSGMIGWVVKRHTEPRSFDSFRHFSQHFTQKLEFIIRINTYPDMMSSPQTKIHLQ